MSGPCHHSFATAAGGETSFSIDPSAVVFGRGALAELGEHARSLGMRRVALFTDPRVRSLGIFETARHALASVGCDVALFDGVAIEPTDASFLEAARFAKDGDFDGFVSLGGGSVMDTCKAAALYATYPADFLAYVNAPLGEGRPVPGPLAPHIACPTTTGTGSETTGIAVFDLVSKKAKTGIVSRRLRPTLALVDPDAAASLPAEVVAASGFDVLCHAIESYTARPYTQRARPSPATSRPMSQGANPWSDMGSLEALRLTGRYLLRAVRDASDHEARQSLMWAATLAGIAFGNAGVHLPHGMAYSIAGLVRGYEPPGYPPGHAMVPHGVSVVLAAPSVFRFTASACPDRHLEAALALGAETRGATDADAGAILSERLLSLMRDAAIPNGLRAVGYGTTDLEALAAGAFVQRRLVENAPCPVGRDDLRGIFTHALSYW